MRRVVALAILLAVPTSGCGYLVCRSFGNSSKQCAYDCTWDYALDAEGNRDGDKLIESCTYSPGKVLMP